MPLFVRHLTLAEGQTQDFRYEQSGRRGRRVTRGSCCEGWMGTNVRTELSVYASLPFDPSPNILLLYMHMH